MNTTIQKWGNSYAVRLPKAILRRFKLKPGRVVRVQESRSGQELRIVPVVEDAANLSTLVSRITDKNKHDAYDWGEPVGKEVW